VFADLIQSIHLAKEGHQSVSGLPRPLAGRGPGPVLPISHAKWPSMSDPKWFSPPVPVKTQDIGRIRRTAMLIENAI
jgi:hypothetical protein